MCVSVYLPVNVNERMSLKQSTFYDVEKKHTPGGARTHNLSIAYYVLLIVVMSQIIKSMHLKYISIFQGPRTKKLYMKMTKIWIADVRGQPFWILRFVGKRCHLQLGIWQKWIKHKKNHIETINEVPFHKNTYWSLSRAIFHFFPDYLHMASLDHNGSTTAHE